MPAKSTSKENVGGISSVIASNASALLIAVSDLFKPVVSRRLGLYTLRSAT